MRPAEGSAWEERKVRRRSRETDVLVTIGRAAGTVPEVRLPDPLIAHGVESFASWGGVPLRLEAKGDLHHHVVEDGALALGRALREALGAAPRHRVGSASVPMDDALVDVALDLSDRPYAVLDERLPVGVRHFLRSLATEARWTVHVRIRAGEDEHHVVEAAFKALGLAFAAAARPLDRPRSRKGSVEWSGG